MLGIGQALDDRVDILDTVSGEPVLTDVPARVYNLESITPFVAGEPNRLLEELRVMLGPSIYVNRADHQIRWRSKTYTPDSDPMWFRQHGVDHHQTIVLKHVEG